MEWLLAQLQAGGLWLCSGLQGGLASAPPVCLPESSMVLLTVDNQKSINQRLGLGLYPVQSKWVVLPQLMSTEQESACHLPGQEQKVNAD